MSDDTPREPGPVDGLPDPDFAELVQSVRDLKAFLRGEPTASRVTEVRPAARAARPEAE